MDLNFKPLLIYTKSSFNYISNILNKDNILSKKFYLKKLHIYYIIAKQTYLRF